MLNLLAVNISEGFGSPFGQEKTIGDLVGVILRGAFVIAGIFVLVMFLIAGFSLMQSAGSNNPEAAQKGKNAVTAAVTGFVVVFAAYWIVRLIEEISGGVRFITRPGF